MPKEQYVPDSKEPHLHIHANGVTFTDARHHHTNLADNAKTLTSNCKKVIQDLGDTPREKAIKDWIKKNL